MPSKQTVWKSRANQYAKKLNAYLAKGEREGWENPGKPPGFRDDGSLAEAALAAVRHANQNGSVAELRHRWPPMHHLLLPLIEAKAQDIPSLFALDDGGFVARIGSPYHSGQVIQVDDDHVTVVQGIHHIGRSLNRRYFAVADDSGVRVTEGWLGIEICHCPWPTGLEGVPNGAQVKPLTEAPVPNALVPFADGKRVLLACEDGVFVLAPAGATRLLPRPEYIRELCEDSSEASISLDDSMTHAALSPDGHWIAAGSQCQGHFIFNQNLQTVAHIGHMSEYPHHACFSSDSQTVILNSCHFYHGATIAVGAADWIGLETPPYELSKKTRIVEEVSRVYAALHRRGEFIIGNANGYLRAFSEKGKLHWYHHVGSTVTAMDLSPDGHYLYAASIAGWVVRIALDTHNPAPHEIGSGQNTEERRWLFWKDQPNPLVW
jgi:hypothetical protein